MLGRQHHDGGGGIPPRDAQQGQQHLDGAATIRGLHEAARPGQIESYVQGLRDLDAIRYIGRTAPVPVFLQFGKYDQLFDEASMQRYAAAASEPKRVTYYDTGHDLNDVQAFQDRYDWLVKYIGLPKINVISSAQ